MRGGSMGRLAAYMPWKLQEPFQRTRQRGTSEVDVAVFSDEEGHFGSFLGSRSFTGVLDENEIEQATDRATGLSIRQALRTAGWVDRPRHLIDPSRYAAFFEAHIEQGDTLENANLKIGIVTAIVAIWQYRFTVVGEQNHAGTTSMARRRDAGLELVRFLRMIDQRFPEICGPRSVWTTGRIDLDTLPADDDVLTKLHELGCKQQFEAWVRERTATKR